MEKLFTKLTNIACAIRNRTGKKELLTLDGMAAGVDEVYEVGRAQGVVEGCSDEYDRFWNSFQLNGTRTNYVQAFSGVCWRDDTLQPKYPIIAKTANDMFAYNSGVTKIEQDIIINATTTVYRVFNGCSSLEKVSSLKVNEEVGFSAWFSGCKALTTINFTEDSVIGNNISFGTCPLLPDSLLNIISVLKDFRTTKTFAAPFEATAGLTFNVFYPFIEVDDLGILKYEADAEGSVVGMPLLRDLSSEELNELKYATEISFDSSGESFTVKFPITKSQSYDCSFKTWQEEYMADFMEAFPTFAYGKFFAFDCEADTVFITIGDAEPGITFDEELPAEISEATHIAFNESGESITLKFATASTVRTLTIGAANLEKLTDLEKAQATQKGWTLA